MKCFQNLLFYECFTFNVSPPWTIYLLYRYLPSDRSVGGYFRCQNTPYAAAAPPRPDATRVVRCAALGPALVAAAVVGRDHLDRGGRGRRCRTRPRRRLTESRPSLQRRVPPGRPRSPSSGKRCG